MFRIVRQTFFDSHKLIEEDLLLLHLKTVQNFFEFLSQYSKFHQRDSAIISQFQSKKEATTYKIFSIKVIFTNQQLVWRKEVANFSPFHIWKKFQFQRRRPA
jgi:hypothetical protein